MKKTLIALAVLAASGAAMAQSSVTLYGVVDAYVGSLKSGLSTTAGGAANLNAVSQTGVNSGGISTSRWGLKGSEDLGGGLKANFMLEQGIKLDDGTLNTTGVNFDRHAWVGLSGGFGSVMLGRTYSAYDVFHDAVNNSANLNLTPTVDVAKAAGGDYTELLNNQVQYVSPVFGGFSAAIGVSLGENKNDSTTTPSNAGQNATDTVSLAIKYANGPLLVGYAYQSEDQLGGVESNDYNLIGGTYDFGVAKLAASYNRTTRAADSKDNEYQLGVSVPFGATTVYLGYASGKTKVAGLETEKASGWDVIATYSLSKRSDLYAGYKSVTEKNGAGTEVGEKKQVAFGMRHVF